MIDNLASLKIKNGAPSLEAGISLIYNKGANAYSLPFSGRGRSIFLSQKRHYGPSPCRNTIFTAEVSVSVRGVLHFGPVAEAKNHYIFVEIPQSWYLVSQASKSGVVLREDLSRGKSRYFIEISEGVRIFLYSPNDKKFFVSFFRGEYSIEEVEMEEEVA